MKILIAVLMLFQMSSSQAGECLKIEYQELKDWSDDQLVKKFCEDKKDYDNHVALASFLELSAQTSKGMGDINGAAKTWNRWSEVSGSAKVCKNEIERTSRLLSQRRLDEGSLNARCPKNGG